jgi:hypothetical protein
MDENNETQDSGKNDANENNETGQRVQQNDADGNLIQCTSLLPHSMHLIIIASSFNAPHYFLNQCTSLMPLRRRYKQRKR